MVTREESKEHPIVQSWICVASIIIAIVCLLVIVAQFQSKSDGSPILFLFSLFGFLVALIFAVGFSLDSGERIETLLDEKTKAKKACSTLLDALASVASSLDDAGRDALSARLVHAANEGELSAEDICAQIPSMFLQPFVSRAFENGVLDPDSEAGRVFAKHCLIPKLPRHKLVSKA